MPDNRRIRKDDPLMYPQLVSYPEVYTPLDRLGVAQGGMALESTPGMNAPTAEALPPVRPGVKLDQSSPASGTAPEYVNPGDDSYRSPLQTIPEGLGAIGSALGNDIRSGLNAITPSRSTIDDIGMRLQYAHAIGTGQLPMYMQMQRAQQEYSQANELMAMKRATMAQELQKQKLAQQEKDEQQVLGIWQSNLPMSQKKKMSDFYASKGIALASNLSRLGNEHLIGQMETLGKYLPPGKVDELTAIMRQPNADLSQVEPWINFAEERHKAYGQAQMKAERFTGLLQAYNNGQIQPGSPEYDEFKQGVLERKKQQDESNQMDLHLQSLGLTNKKAQQELAASSVMPHYGPEVLTNGGKVQRDKFDPQTGTLTTITGDKPPASVTNVNMKQESAFEGELGKENVKDIKGTQAKAKEAVIGINTIHQARNLLDSGVITGVGAEYRTKFGQALQQMGFSKSDNKIANTQAFTALMASNVGQMIKQFGAGTGLSDADREFATKMAGGDISIDEQSIRKILDLNEKASRNVIKLHNQSVKGIKSMIPLDVPEPAEYTKPQSSNNFIETRTTKDGRRLGKTKDGKIVEIK